LLYLTFYREEKCHEAKTQYIFLLSTEHTTAADTASGRGTPVVGMLRLQQSKSV